MSNEISIGIPNKTFNNNNLDFSSFALSNDKSINSINVSRDIICRICLDHFKENSNLIAPCHCTGTMKYVHNTCLKTWIEENNKNISFAECEICKFKYKVKIKKKATVDKSKCKSFVCRYISYSAFIFALVAGFIVCIHKFLIEYEYLFIS